ncbi:MAG TPA: hypothetical protein IGS53_13335 [Leptolyngbyaceae cyanobacterium M33_DOE_097]|nr:hypothetical protein [Leptolyngbyaceae cyanobacterium M33_DOE_097]
MFSHPRWVPQPNSEPPEVIITFEFTRNFYREVAHRQEFEQYCDWYYKTALKNRNRSGGAVLNR